MNIQIGQVIREHRKKLGLTQEQVAARLGVTTPAVNKWENGVSNPDIELLAPLARLFGISTDELLSYREELSEEEIVDFTEELAVKLRDAAYAEAFAWAQETIGRYPNCRSLIWKMALILDVHRMTEKVEDAERYDDRILSWFETALSDGQEETRKGAADSLFQFWMRREEYEKAEPYLAYFAESDPIGKINRARLCQARDDTEGAYRIYEQMLFSASTILRVVISMMSALALKEDDMNLARYYTEKSGEFARCFELGRYSEISGLLELACREKNVEETLCIAKELLQSVHTLNDFRTSGLYRHLELSTAGSSEAVYDKVRGELLTMFREDEETFGFMRDSREWEELLA